MDGDGVAPPATHRPRRRHAARITALALLGLVTLAALVEAGAGRGVWSRIAAGVVAVVVVAEAVWWTRVATAGRARGGTPRRDDAGR